MWTQIYKPSASKTTFFAEIHTSRIFGYCLTILYLAGISISSIGYAKPIRSTLSVKVIEAQANRKASTPKVDHKLLSIKDSLVKSFPKLSRFKYLQSHKVSLRQGKKQTVSITRNLTVKLTPLSNHQKQLTVKMEVPQKKASFKLKAQKGQLFYQAMHWKNKVYILAFKAK